MRNLLVKALLSIPYIIAVAGFLVILGAAGASDCGTPFPEVMPTLLTGLGMMLGGGVAIAIIEKKECE